LPCLRLFITRVLLEYARKQHLPRDCNPRRDLGSRTMEERNSGFASRVARGPTDEYSERPTYPMIAARQRARCSGRPRVVTYITRENALLSGLQLAGRCKLPEPIVRGRQDERRCAVDGKSACRQARKETHATDVADIACVSTPRRPCTGHIARRADDTLEAYVHVLAFDQYDTRGSRVSSGRGVAERPLNR
jgi:hypothetical protein